MKVSSIYFVKKITLLVCVIDMLVVRVASRKFAEKVARDRAASCVSRKQSQSD